MRTKRTKLTVTFSQDGINLSSFNLALPLMTPVRIPLSVNVEDNAARMDFAGRIVFIEPVPQEGKDTSYYGSGEYAVVRHTPFTIYGVKLQVGYGGHEIKSFSMEGTNKFHVVDVYEDDDLIMEWIRDQRVWANSELESPKRQWVESVYTSALDAARQLERALERKEG